MKKLSQSWFGRSIMTLVVFFLLMEAVQAQDITVRGTVTDESGEILPGVTVVNKGTLTGTVTNAEGKYRLEVGEDAVLTFSFVGYLSKEVQAGSRTEVNVQLSADLVSLDEVVVTALGLTREKEALGYAVQELEGNELNPSNDPNIVNSLSGKIAGVQVTSGGRYILGYANVVG